MVLILLQTATKETCSVLMKRQPQMFVYTKDGGKQGVESTVYLAYLKFQFTFHTRVSYVPAHTPTEIAR